MSKTFSVAMGSLSTVSSLIDRDESNPGLA
jgi:hypothetical protein